MAGSVNKAIIIGHLGRDPEIRTFQNGGKVCNLRVATSETWRDKATGERRERTEWHSVVIFNENALRVAEQYLRKGSKVYIEGQIETREHTGQDGNKRYYTEIVLRPYRGEITILDRLDNGSRGTAEDYDRHDQPRTGSGASNTTQQPAGHDPDDEIPF